MRSYSRFLVILAALLFGSVPAAQGGEPAASADGPRQGGEVISDAALVWRMPFSDAGTTVGYRDDYDAECPSPSDSPDVVYVIRRGMADAITIDLCGADYDTKVYVYGGSGSGDTLLVACNDDFPCPRSRSVQSRVVNVGLGAFPLYWIVVDGANGESGDYVMEIHETVGACCDREDKCVLTTEVDCPGDWRGPDTACEPNPCSATPVRSRTWGIIKAHYRGN